MSRKEIIKLDTLEIREGYEAKPGIKDSILKKVRSCTLLSCIYSVIPIVKWLPEYPYKENFVKDLIAGVTIGVFHIPQGMAYGLLGNVDPIVGIYMAFFPGLVYIIFGSSRHNSIGTFAVICLMAGKPILEFSNEKSEHYLLSNSNTTPTEEEGEIVTRMQVAVALAFTVAIFHLSMYFLRLGVLCRLLSDTFISAFVMGCAIHVFMSQMKELFGFKMPRQTGYFKNGFVAYSTIVHMPEANVATVIISAISFVILVLHTLFLKPYVSKLSRIPIPMELIIVVIGTIFSYFLDLESRYGITIVGNIPSGLPVPKAPDFSLMKILVVDAMSIAITSYAITASLAITYAQKELYEIDLNQELLALGLCNLCGSFFSCMPISAALARSSVQYMAGAVTQITSLISCVVLLVVLLWIGPLFYSLPRSILASIIVVALKGMLGELHKFMKLWKLCKYEAFLWIASFLVVSFVDIIIGLLTGIVLSILLIVFHSSKPTVCLLGVLPNTEVYLDVGRYKQVAEIPGIKIYHFVAGINFITKSMYSAELYKKVNCNPKKFYKDQHNPKNMDNTEMEQLLFKHLILDLSAVPYVDPVGVSKLIALHKDFARVNIQVYLAGPSGSVYDSIVRCDYYENKSNTFIIFSSVHDAVLYVKQNLTRESKTI